MKKLMDWCCKQCQAVPYARYQMIMDSLTDAENKYNSLVLKNNILKYDNLDLKKENARMKDVLESSDKLLETQRESIKALDNALKSLMQRHIEVAQAYELALKDACSIQIDPMHTRMGMELCEHCEYRPQSGKCIIDCNDGDRFRIKIEDKVDE